MSYFPIISAPDCNGRTTLFNYPPNNWEFISAEPQLVNLTWSEDDVWRSVTVDEIPYGSIRSYQYSDFPFLPKASLPLLSLSSHSFPDISNLLPATKHTNSIPTWRGTIELYTSSSSTSYQGELDAFPVPSSLLTISPLIQFHDSIKNYLLLLNLELSPITRKSLLRIYKCNNDSPLIGNFEVTNNAITAVCLDSLSLLPDDLSVGVISDMSAIPLYLSYSTYGDCLSLEHTPPPASYFIHGKRWQLQSHLKRRWFSKLLSR